MRSVSSEVGLRQRGRKPSNEPGTLGGCLLLTLPCFIPLHYSVHYLALWVAVFNQMNLEHCLEPAYSVSYTA